MRLHKQIYKSHNFFILEPRSFNLGKYNINNKGYWYRNVNFIYVRKDTILYRYYL